MGRSVCESDTLFPVSTRAFRHCDDAVLGVSAEGLLLNGGRGDTGIVVKEVLVKANDSVPEVPIRAILVGVNAPHANRFGLRDGEGFVREYLIEYPWHDGMLDQLEMSLDRCCRIE
jgi:hypothetical protein